MSNVGQLNLFDALATDAGPGLKAAINQAVADSGLSREQVVDRVNALAGLVGVTTNGRAGKLTIDLLNKYCSTDPHYLPGARLIPLICRATGSIAPIAALAKSCGATVISADDLKLLEWAQLQARQKADQRRLRQLQKELGI